MKRLNVLFLVIPLLSACASPGQILNPTLFYKRDMQIQMDGVQGAGVLVVPQKARHDFSVTAKGPMALYSFNTCHREVALENMPKTVGGYFTPTVGLEDQGGCSLEFGAFDKAGPHSWGFVDFETSEAKLPAVLKCNGETTSSRGVSVCQSREGLYQQIEFPAPVAVAGSCGAISGDGKTFRWPLKKGQCVYAFKEQGGEGRIHRLTTLGYESILIRGE